MQTATKPKSSSRKWTPTAGTSTCPTSGRASTTAIASTEPWDPASGLRCNPNKLLLDPYAKAIDGAVDWNPTCFAYNFGDEDSRNDDASASHVFKSVVHNPYFDWGNDRPPATPLHESVIYEMHVKGFTARHPEIPEALRGTYAGLAHPVAIEYLKELGVTAIELLPVHQFVHDAHLLERGLRNYWGYKRGR